MWGFPVSVYLMFLFVLLQPGLATQMLNAAEERPWLWVVYVLTVALPLVLIIVFCCTGKVTHTLSVLYCWLIDVSLYMEGTTVQDLVYFTLYACIVL